MKIQNYERQLFGTFSRKSTKSCVHYITAPTILNGVLSLKTQNFPVKSNSENRFTFVQKNSE